MFNNRTSEVIISALTETEMDVVAINKNIQTATQTSVIGTDVLILCHDVQHKSTY